MNDLMEKKSTKKLIELILGKASQKEDEMQEYTVDEINDIFGGTETSSPIDDWEYTIDSSNGLVRLTKYIGTNPDVVVYASYDIDGETYQTVAGGSYVYSDDIFMANNTLVTSVTFEDGVMISAYNGYMFRNCTNLVSAKLALSANLPKFSTTDWMPYMFDNCPSLKFVDLQNWFSYNITVDEVVGYAPIVSMFGNCAALEQVLVTSGRWNTSFESYYARISIFDGAGISDFTYV